MELARRNSKNPRSPALVNGILRAFCRQKENLPWPEECGVRYSHPKWLVEALDEALDHQGTEELLACNNSQPPTTIQTNTLCCEPDSLCRELESEGKGGAASPRMKAAELLGKRLGAFNESVEALPPVIVDDIPARGGADG